ncbi:uncharacterized protein [Miscanthus floridulus]|uniref:uncharacterized protein n=1 Tax=Miscanthus floridulus TaxID=154761 RepID=UPI003457699A
MQLKHRASSVLSKKSGGPPSPRAANRRADAEAGDGARRRLAPSRISSTAASATSPPTSVAAWRVQAVTGFKGISAIQKFALWQVRQSQIIGNGSDVEWWSFKRNLCSSVAISRRWSQLHYMVLLDTMKPSRYAIKILLVIMALNCTMSVPF